jgi:hypothetical protein
MPVRPLIDFEGAIDIHVHSAPSYTHIRPYDDDQTAQFAAMEGMTAIMLKDHTEPTVTRAHLAQKAAPSVRVFGGVVLNHSVGGINPDAADFACTMNGKKVWFPTVDAAHHAGVFTQGGYGSPTSDIGPANIEKRSRHLLKKGTISILRDGQLIDEAKDVVQICKVWDVMVGTGHLGKDEVLALVKYARAERFEKLVVTHVNWSIMCDYDVDELLELKELGAWLEFCTTAIAASPTPTRTAEEEAQLLNAVGPERCVLASDAGAQVFGTAPSVFRGSLQLLRNEGVSDADIRTMAWANPRRLLNLN